jgi:hypothetical protein
MPSEVQGLYQALLKEGRTPKDAAKEAQKRTGFALVTDEPIKAKQLTFSQRGVRYGQSTQLKKKPGKQGTPRQFP